MNGVADRSPSPSMPDLISLSPSPVPRHSPAPTKPALLSLPPIPEDKPMDVVVKSSLNANTWQVLSELLVDLAQIDRDAIANNVPNVDEIKGAVRILTHLISLYPEPAVLLYNAEHILLANIERLENYAARKVPEEPGSICPALYTAAQINGRILREMPEPWRLYQAIDCHCLVLNPTIPDGASVPPRALRLKVGAVCVLVKSLPAHRIPANTIVVVQRLRPSTIVVKTFHEREEIVLSRTEFTFFRRHDGRPYRRRQFPLQMVYARHYRNVKDSAMLTYRVMEGLKPEHDEDNDVAMVEDGDLPWQGHPRLVL
ncbi:hypothetical protein BV25DRAFT_1921446 [Artomyces pyxidatus]|uniref:Uncharacterized protein n=1 Tax=Artomyces pyxidatus TaxID=48021 RepID=A0ACB8SHQ0_9AGAM|nr:hypothetical protein BV25DRAFT_1921446 [Artomyces pyxidatus]